MDTKPELIELQSEKPEITRLGLGLGVLIAFLYAVLYTAILSYVEHILFAEAFLGTVLSTLIKICVLFGIWYLLVRELYHLRGWVKLILHIIVGLAYVFVWYHSYLFVFDQLIGLEYLKGGGFIQDKIWIMISTYFEYAIIFSVIHIIESVKKLRKRERQAAELRELSNQQQIASLKAQINPHFLFNTLNSINAMVSKDVGQTRSMIAKLSEMLRYSLESFERERISLIEEIAFVGKYLEFEKHRCGDRLDYSINMDEELSAVEIPPMTIQPLVENAVKHGIAPTEEGGTVTLSAFQKGSTMKVEVIDTGQGMGDPQKLENSDGIGIRNTDKHLKKRYGKESALQFDQITPSGTKVWFTIPIEK